MRLAGGIATTPAQIRNWLVGRRQGWLTQVRECLHTTPDRLDALVLAPGDPRWEALAEDGQARWHDEAGPPASGAIRPLCSAANAVVSVARALAGETYGAVPSESLGVAVAHWERACCVSVPGRGPASEEPRDPTLPNRLLADLDSPGATFVALLARELAGIPPGCTRRVEVPVLLDRRSRGVSAVLRLALRDGPPGLHPDPATMAFLATDPEFVEALGVAWDHAPIAGSGACVTWSVLEAGHPCNDVYGASLGVAVAIALHELGAPRRRLPLGRIDPGCALTGRLRPDGTVGPVDGYPAKLQAAHRKQLRVVLPAASRDDIQALADRTRVNASWAGTLREAIGKSRRYRLTQVLMVTGMLLATLGMIATIAFWAGGSTSRQQRDAARRAQKAADLTAQALDLRQSDPRLAGLLALAAHDTAPAAPGPVDAMRQIVGNNQNVARTWQAAPSSVSAVAVDDPRDRIYTAGDDHMIKSWNLTRGGLTGQIAGRADRLALGPTTPLLVAADDRALTMYDVAGRAPVTLGRLPVPSCATAVGRPLSVEFTVNGAGLATVWSDGAIATYDVVSRTQTRCIGLLKAATADQLSDVDRTTPVIAAAIAVDDDVVPDSARDRAVIVTSSRQVLTVGLRDGKVRVELNSAVLHGTPTGVAASPNLLAINTSGGVLVWDRVRHQPVTFPAGGMAQPASAVALWLDNLVIAGTFGTSKLALSSGGGSPEAQFQGGPAAVATVGTSGTVVSGGPAGRLRLFTQNGGALARSPAPAASAITFTPGSALLLAQWSSSVNWGVFTIDTAHPPTRPPKDEYRHLTDYNGQVDLDTRSLAWSPQYVAAGGRTGQGGSVVIWNTDGSRYRRLLFHDPHPSPGEDDVVVDVAFAPGRLVARHSTGRLIIAETGTWRAVAEKALGTGGTAMAVGGSRGVFAAGAGPDAQIVSLDLATGAETARTSLPDLQRLTITPDGTRIAALSRGDQVQLLDARLRPLPQHWRLPAGPEAGDLALSPDGRRLAVARGPSVLVYDTTTQVQAMPPLIENTGNTVEHLAWSPDGALLAGTTRLLGRTGPEYGGANLWVVKDADWTTQVCGWTGGGLTPDEWRRWRRYLGQTFFDLCKKARS